MKLKSLLGRKVRLLELGKAVEIMGNQKTFTNRNAEMTIIEQGVLAVSKKTGEEIVIFESDCVAAKLLPESAEA